MEPRRLTEAQTPLEVSHALRQAIEALRQGLLRLLRGCQLGRQLDRLAVALGESLRLHGHSPLELGHLVRQPSEPLGAVSPHRLEE